MLPSYLLSLREGIEIALIIGIVLGALRKVHHEEMTPAVWYGVISATVVSIITGVVLTMFGLSLESPAEQIFEGITMVIAAGVLTWMIFWMRQQSRNMKSEIEAGVHQATQQMGSRALFTLAFFAVVREGIELAIFLTATAFTSDAVQTISGAALGLGTAALLGWSLFATTVKLDLRRFFQVTGFLLILFAAGLFAHAIHEFNEIGWVPAIIEHVWDVNFIIDETSMVGTTLKALFGYNGNPSLTEVIAYLAYFAGILTALRLSRKPQTATAKSEA